MPNLKADKRGGYYWKDGKPYVSVTKVLNVISKPALMYWYGKEVYIAMVKEPSLSQEEALSKPYEASRGAASRGTTVHSIIEAYKNTGKVVEMNIPQFKGYIDAFNSWLANNKIEVVENEKTVFSDKYHYAGTLDMLAKVNGKLVIVDLKTSKDGEVYPEASLQVSAYRQALLEAGVEIEEAFILGVGENGKYNFRQAVLDLPAFLHAQGLWVWQNKEECKKMGYVWREVTI